MTSVPCRSRLAIACGAVSCLAVLATACGSAASPAVTPTKTVTVTAAPTAPASTGATSPGASSPAGVAACPTRDLAAKAGLSQGAAGSTYVALDFTNIGTVTCTLYGYPGVSLAGGKPVSQIGLAADESSTTPRQLVTLPPGAVASALLRIVSAVNYPKSKCHPAPATYLQIYPPNQTTPIYLGYTATGCTKPVRLLTIGVVQPGSGGSS
jgi:hypothetical protein